MSLTIHQFTRTGDAPASPPSLLEAGWEAVRQASSEGWVDVEPPSELELEKFDLGENLYAYAFPPPRLPTEVNRQESTNLEEWDQPLHEDEVYTLADLADFESGLTILSDQAPATSRDNVQRRSLESTSERLHIVSPKHTALLASRPRNSMTSPHPETLAAVPHTPPHDPSFVPGDHPPSVLPNASPNPLGPADDNIDMAVLGEDEGKDQNEGVGELTLLEHSEGMHLAGPPSPHSSRNHSEDEDSIYGVPLRDQDSGTNHATAPVAAETVHAEDKESANKELPSTVEDTAPMDEEHAHTPEVHGPSVALASPPRFFATPSPSPPAVPEGLASAPGVFGVESSYLPTGGRLYSDEEAEEDQILDSEEDELNEDVVEVEDEMEGRSDTFERDDTLILAHWRAQANDLGLDEVGMEIDEEQIQEDEQDELQDEDLTIDVDDNEGEPRLNADHIEEDNVPVISEHGNDDGISLYAGSQASALEGITYVAEIVHNDSSERDELEDNDSIMQDQSDTTPSLNAAAIQAVVPDDASDALSYVTKPPSAGSSAQQPSPSRDQDSEAASDASQRTIRQEPHEPAPRNLSTVESAISHRASPAGREASEPPFESLYDLLPQPHVYTVPLPSGDVPFRFDLEPTSPAFSSLDAMFSTPGSIAAPTPIEPHTSDTALAHLQLPFARAAWLIPVRGRMPWAGGSDGVLVSEPHPAVGSGTASNTDTKQITWTPPSVLAFWDMLLLMREEGSYGPLGISFNAARPRPKPKSTTVNPDPRIALTTIDHIKIHLDAARAAEVRRVLESWEYADGDAAAAGVKEESEWDFDEGAPIYVPSDGEDGSARTSSVGLHLDSDDEMDAQITGPNTPSAGDGVESTPTKAKSARLLEGATLVLVDERNRGLLLC
ncbi:hypothetical protein EIP86_003413 [Pleurotus ostreatoroseus]|nr:hypothetical protein EIP86_003413 [Pleurotus ostreatoroseus]